MVNQMNVNLEVEIIYYIQENGPVSSKNISEFLDFDKKEIYAFLTECEKENIVVRTSGIDDGIIVFHWSINPNNGALNV